MSQVGDKPGHPFRGNQYGSKGGAQGGGSAYDRRIKAFTPTAAEHRGVKLEGGDTTIQMAQTAATVSRRGLNNGQQRFVDDVVARKGRGESVSPEQEMNAREFVKAQNIYEGRRKEAAAPDLDHLSRENKIPANVSDVPAGGKGGYQRASYKK